MNDEIKKESLWEKIGSTLAILMSIFHIYTSTFGVLEAWRHRSIHVVFILLLAFIITKRGMIISSFNRWITVLASIAVSAYMILDYSKIIFREGDPNNLDIAVCMLLLCLVIEAARRWVGTPMAVLCIIFVAYAFLGYMLSGRLSTADFSIHIITTQLFNSTSGIMGTTTSVAATNVVMFILFGAFLQRSGGSDFFSDFSIIATRNVVGGPAKAAIFASALIGTIQGNAISNVVTTGTFTIPLMKRAGYSPTFAGAVEAAASTGGMIMPPVMGAAAFLLAEMTRTPYSTIVIYSIIPACLYFVALFIMIHLRALKIDIQPITQAVKLKGRELYWQGANCTLPIVLLVMALLKGYSPMLSATWAIGLIILIWIIRPFDRMTIKCFLSALEEGGKSMITVSSACIAAGIVVGLISLTGIGTKVAVLVSIAQGNIWMVLVLSMIVCLVLGMGLPVAASYVIAAVTLGGVLQRAGIDVVAGHLFLMYFATISAITPPVALASYAAAGISGASANKTGIQAFMLALSGFIIPYVFVFSKELFMVGSTINIIIAVATALAGIFSLSVSMEGWMFCKVTLLFRVLHFVAAMLLIVVGGQTDIIGALLLIILVGINFMSKNKNK